MRDRISTEPLVDGAGFGLWYNSRLQEMEICLFNLLITINCRRAKALRVG